MRFKFLTVCFSIAIIVIIGTNFLNAKTIGACGDIKRFCLVSLVSLIVSPEQHNGKIIRVNGYVWFIESGPYSGVWLTQQNDFFDLPSSVKIALRQQDVELSWLKNQSLNTVVGVFVNCQTINCRPEIKRIKDEGMVYGYTRLND